MAVSRITNSDLVTASAFPPIPKAQADTPSTPGSHGLVSDSRHSTSVIATSWVCSPLVIQSRTRLGLKLPLRCRSKEGKNQNLQRRLEQILGKNSVWAQRMMSCLDESQGLPSEILAGLRCRRGQEQRDRQTRVVWDLISQESLRQRSPEIEHNTK